MKEHLLENERSKQVFNHSLLNHEITGDFLFKMNKNPHWDFVHLNQEMVVFKIATTHTNKRHKFRRSSQIDLTGKCGNGSAARQEDRRKGADLVSNLQFVRCVPATHNTVWPIGKRYRRNILVRGQLSN